MDILYRDGSASAAEVMERMPEPPGYSAVRAMLRVLEEKGHVMHKREGLKYIYVPALPREHARTSAVRHLLSTFFNNSPEQVVAALLDESARKLTRQELDRMADMIERAKKEGR